MNTDTMTSLTSPENYLNRELSMLEFNQRVLDMACDTTLPLLERLRFLCICSSNMDEFFEVRVAVQKQKQAIGSLSVSADGLTASETLILIRHRVEKMLTQKYELFNDDLIPAMRDEGISFLHRNEWNDVQKKWIASFFKREVLPVLTPIGLDPAHPFPRLLSKILNFMISLEGKDAFGRDSKYAVVQAPRSVQRVIRLPDEIASSPDCYVFLSSIIHEHVDDLFPGMRAKSCHQFRITRDSEIDLNEESEDLKKAIAGELVERQFGHPVRLEVSDKCPLELTNYLLRQFNLQESDLYRADGPVNLYRLAIAVDEISRADLKFPPFEASIDKQLRDHDLCMFDHINQGDVLLHHPFQSFDPVVELLNQAASDPGVMAIKQTLYRAVPGSPIVNALVKAARHNKEVVAVIELRARYNEGDNIVLADTLSAAGVQVVYGVVGYKTHCKMMLIVRKEGKKIRRYVHLGTGNYHSITSRFYTDLGLMSSDPDLGEDVHRIFQQLTGLGRATKLKTMMQAPFTLHSGLMDLIRIETANANAGAKGKIIAKMNGLEEPELIRALYEASIAGVKIDLIVRGICCLRPGVKGLSENIRVRSVLGRFLEHTRVFYFLNGGESLIFCSSADWMTRNQHHRIETCFPIKNKKIALRVLNTALKPYLADNTGAWALKSTGEYRRVQSKSAPRSAQLELMEAMGRLGKQA
ncbi:MAG: polyphosphate kinase 1 [Ghiorsea sp.]